jgi:hypothetical protein
VSSAFSQPSYPHFDTRCPAVRSETIEITRVVDLSDGARILAPAHSTATIHWIRQSETTIRLLDRDGHIVREFETYSDFHGLLTSVVEPIRRGADLTRRYAIEGSQSLSIEALLTVTDSPAWEDDPLDPAKRGFRRYIPVPDNVYRRDDRGIEAWLSAKFPERGEIYKKLSPIRPMRVVEREPVYSSQNPALDYRQVLRRALQGIEAPLADERLLKIEEALGSNNGE